MARTKNTPTETEAEEAEAPETFSPKDLAAELGVDAKTFRRWLRRHTSNRAGKGGRWVFDTDAKAELIAAYRKDETEAKADPPAIPEVDDAEEELNDELAELEL